MPMFILGVLAALLAILLLFGNIQPPGGSPDAGGFGSGRIGAPLPPIAPLPTLPPATAPSFQPPPFLDILPEPPKPARQPRGDYTDAIWKIVRPGASGTAFVLGKTDSGRTLLATSAHCVPDLIGEYSLCGGMDGEETCYPGVTVVEADYQNDVALVSAPPVTPYRALPISQWRSGEIGQEVLVSGYGGGRFSEHFTVLNEITRVSNATLNREGLMPGAWSADLVASPGHSGSPAIDGDGFVVGLLCAGNAEANQIVHPRYLRWLLERVGEDGLVDRRGVGGQADEATSE